MQPLREEQVDLLDVLLEGGVAGGVVLHVVGGAQTFAGVEGDIGGLAGGLAARGALFFQAVQQNGTVGQRLVVVPGGGQQKLWHLLITQHIVDKNRHHQRGNHGCGIKNAAQAFPALPLRVEEYLLIRHEVLF